MKKSKTGRLIQGAWTQEKEDKYLKIFGAKPINVKVNQTFVIFTNKLTQPDDLVNKSGKKIIKQQL